MIELVDPCNVWMLFLRGDVKRLLRFLGNQGIQILQGYIAAPLLYIGWVVAAAWWTGCETIRHMTDCVVTIPLHVCVDRGRRRWPRIPPSPASRFVEHMDATRCLTTSTCHKTVRTQTGHDWRVCSNGLSRIIIVVPQTSAEDFATDGIAAAR
jgi:hypothetical protein